MTEKPDNHIDEPKDGDSLGLQLRLLYNRAYDEGYYKGRHSEQYNTNTPNKTEHVATAYKAIDQYYADFYRNKILEARVDEVGNFLDLLDKEFAYYSGGKPYSKATGTENDNARTKRVIDDRIAELTAQFNSKE